MIAAGNAKVLSSRLSDARFFWDEDVKVGFEPWLKKLDGVTFHAKLGTMAERVEKIKTELELERSLALLPAVHRAFGRTDPQPCHAHLRVGFGGRAIRLERLGPVLLLRERLALVKVRHGSLLREPLELRAGGGIAKPSPVPSSNKLSSEPSPSKLSSKTSGDWQASFSHVAKKHACLLSQEPKLFSVLSSRLRFEANGCTAISRPLQGTQQDCVSAAMAKRPTFDLYILF